MNITYDVFINRINNIIMSDEKVYNICYRKKNEIYFEYEKIFLGVLFLILLIGMMALICKIYLLKNDNVIIQKVIQID